MPKSSAGPVQISELFVKSAPGPSSTSSEIAGGKAPEMVACWRKQARDAKDYSDMLVLALAIRGSSEATDEQRLLAERVVNSVRKFMRASTVTTEQVARIRFFRLLDALQKPSAVAV